MPMQVAQATADFVTANANAGILHMNRILNVPTTIDLACPEHLLGQCSRIVFLPSLAISCGLKCALTHCTLLMATLKSLP